MIFESMASTWATLFQVLFPVLVWKEMVVKVFRQAAQDSEMVEGNGGDSGPDASLDCSIRDSSEMVEGNAVSNGPDVALDCSIRDSSEIGKTTLYKILKLMHLGLVVSCCDLLQNGLIQRIPFFAKQAYRRYGSL